MKNNVMNKFAYESFKSYLRVGNNFLRGKPDSSRLGLADEACRQAAGYYEILKPKMDNKKQRAEYKKATAALNSLMSKIRARLYAYAVRTIDSSLAEIKEEATIVADAIKTEIDFTKNGSYVLNMHRKAHEAIETALQDVKTAYDEINGFTKHFPQDYKRDKEIDEYATRKAGEVKTLGKKLEALKKSLGKTDSLIDEYWKKTLQNKQN